MEEGVPFKYLHTAEMACAIMYDLGRHDMIGGSVKDHTVSSMFCNFVWVKQYINMSNLQYYLTYSQIFIFCTCLNVICVCELGLDNVLTCIIEFCPVGDTVVCTRGRSL